MNVPRILSSQLKTKALNFSVIPKCKIEFEYSKARHTDFFI
jgi:hypothetical protein